MKAQTLLATTLIAFSTLQAEECDPSCCPNWSLSVSALFWQAQEDGLDYMIKNESGLAFVNNNGSVKRVDPDWDWGFRLGLGYRSNCDMDFRLNWTWFCTDGTDSTSADFPAGLFHVWTIPGSSLTPATQAKAKWDLKLNIIDLEMGAPLSPTCYLDIRPFIALSTAWIDQKLNIDSSGGVSTGGAALTVLDDAIRMKNDFWGIGPKIGLDTDWCIGCGFSIFGNIDLSLLYGRFDIDQTESILFENLTPATTYLDLKNDKFWLSRASLDIILGVKWEYWFCCDSYYLSIDAGWENLFFFGQNQLKRFVDDSNPGINVPTSGDLSIQGLTLRASFGF